MSPLSLQERAAEGRGEGESSSVLAAEYRFTTSTRQRREQQPTYDTLVLLCNRLLPLI
jgi:hypothetical protein